MIPALGVNEPYASAIVHGLKRWETRGQPPNGEMRPDGVTGFPGVRLPRGGRVMVVANAARPQTVDGWVRHSEGGRHWLDPIAAQFELRRRLWLHPGHIVGSVTVTDALPIVEESGCANHGFDYRQVPTYIALSERHLTLTFLTWRWTVSPTWYIDKELTESNTDQLPWGDWRPGRWAWQLADPKTTNEMCPVCKGHGVITNLDDPWPGTDSFRTVPCPVCRGDGRCDPIPVRGHQGLRPPKPEQFL